MNDGQLFWGTGAAFFVTLCVESYFSWRFLRGLRQDAPDLWRATGERTIWTDGDLISAWGTIKMLWRREYVGHGFKAGEEFCERYRMPVIVSYFAALFSVAVFLAVFVIQNL